MPEIRYWYLQYEIPVPIRLAFEISIRHPTGVLNAVHCLSLHFDQFLQVTNLAVSRAGHRGAKDFSKCPNIIFNQAQILRTLMLKRIRTGAKLMSLNV
jgi:hypothetical protein